MVTQEVLVGERQDLIVVTHLQHRGGGGHDRRVSSTRIELATPTIIQGIPNGYVGLAGQFEWGPVAGKSGGTAVKPTSTANSFTVCLPPSR